MLQNYFIVDSLVLDLEALQTEVEVDLVWHRLHCQLDSYILDSEHANRLLAQSVVAFQQSQSQLGHAKVDFNPGANILVLLFLFLNFLLKSEVFFVLLTQAVVNVLQGLLELVEFVLQLNCSQLLDLVDLLLRQIGL